MKTVNVCFITDNNYTVPTAVAIQSLIENRDKSTKYNIYVVAVNMDSSKFAIFTKLASRYCKIKIVKMYNVYDNINTKHLYVSKVALLKFNLPNIFPRLDKVLYLDGDILVLGDLLELYNTDLDDKYGAVMPDMAGMLYEHHHTKFGFDKYFNSGVMLLNLKKMRNDKISDKLIDYKINKDEGHFMDQDCLNYVFQQNVVYISPIYNWMAGNISGFSDDEIQKFYGITKTDFESMRQNPIILHLTNKQKPWNSNTAVGYYLWWQYHGNMQLKIQKTHGQIERLIRFFFRHKVYSNGRHKFLICGIKVLSYKPRFAPGAEIKGNFFYTKEKCPNGRVHIYICGIKIASYSKHKKLKTETPVPVAAHDLVDDYKNVFERNGYDVVRENGKIKIWNKNITIEGIADNTLWTAASVFCNDEYHFDMNEKYVMFDIGFNLGMTSLHKAQDKNCIKIYAFEPFVPTFELAEHNMDLNKKLSKKITAFNYGLGDKDEVVDINYNPDKPGAMSSVKNIFSECKDVEKIRIKKTSDILKPLFAKHKEKIFLKIDCEGAEKQILPDLEASGLIKQVDVIVMEWHFEDPKWIIDLLTRNGFIVFRLNVITNEIGMIRAYRKCS